MPLGENTNLELFSLIWLDNMADATQENREIQDKLRSVINYLRTFDNCQQCENYIRNEINPEEDKIILILSGRLGQQIIEHIHSLKQIYSIYVFCMDKERNELWAKKYNKVRGVCVQIDILLKEIDLDRKNYQSTEILSTTDEINSLLLEIEYTLIDRKQFLNICSKEYEGNYKEIEKVKEFEHLYSSSDALNYFFKQTFVYRLLIKSIETFNIDILFLLRFFLQDIEEQLKSCSSLSVPVYRAQFLTNQQIEFLKKSINEKSLRFNSFLIANQSRENVLKPLQNLENPNDLNLVLFQIETNQIGKQYGDYILFPITTQFRIISIDYQNQIYSIQIIVSNSKQHSNKKRANSIELAHLLRNQGHLDQAEKLFNRLLSQYPYDKSKYYDGLARIAQDKGLYQNSLDLYQKYPPKVSSKSYPHYLNSLGCVYDYLEEYAKALQCYCESLSLMTNDIDRAMCINNIGITLANQKQYEEALEYFQESLSIREDSLPANHPDLGISYANIGLIYSSMKQSDLALEYYQKALNGFSDNHSSIFQAIVYQNMAQVFYEKNEFADAFKYYQEAGDIFRQIRPMSHPNLIYIEQILNQLSQIK